MGGGAEPGEGARLLWDRELIHPVASAGKFPQGGLLLGLLSYWTLLTHL